MANKPAGVHVSGNRSDGYKVTQGGKTIAGADTQQDAIRQGIAEAKADKAELFIHRADNGQIRERNSYGSDPFPPEG